MPWLLQFSPVWLSSVSLQTACKTMRVPKLTTFHLNLLLSIGCPLICKNSTNSLLCAATASTLSIPSTWRSTNQPASFAVLLILPFFVFPLWAHTCLVRDLFLMLHCLSGTCTLSNLDHQIHLHLLSFFFFFFPCWWLFWHFRWCSQSPHFSSGHKSLNCYTVSLSLSQKTKIN